MEKTDLVKRLRLCVAPRPTSIFLFLEMRRLAEDLVRVTLTSPS